MKRFSFLFFPLGPGQAQSFPLTLGWLAAWAGVSQGGGHEFALQWHRLLPFFYKCPTPPQRCEPGEQEGIAVTRLWERNGDGERQPVLADDPAELKSPEECCPSHLGHLAAGPRVGPDWLPLCL